MWIISAFVCYFTIDFVTPTVDYLQHPVKSCRIGDVVENECNKCLCTSKTVFECAPVDCNKNKYQKETEVSKQLCFPNQLYVQNLITCICTKDGRWPHKSCHDTFQSLSPSNVVKHKCTPDTYVVIDCNVCRCGPDGEIIGDRCTRNACEEESKRRVNRGSNSVYSSCEVKNWYSLAPCQFCFCVNQNKLVCNTGNYFIKKLELGSYNLRVCGKDLIREAIELIPDSQRALRLGPPQINETSATVPQVPITTKATVDPFINLREYQQNRIEVNRESHENRTQAKRKPIITKVEENGSYDKEEYYSDSEEEGTKLAIPEKLVTPVTTTGTPIPINIETPEQQEMKGASTKFPFVEGDEMLTESKMENTDDDNEEYSNEIVVELEQTPFTPPTTTATTQAVSSIKLHALTEENKKQLSASIQQMARGGRSGESYQYIGNTLKINLPKVLNKVFQLALRKSMVSLSSETKCVPGSTSLNNCNMCFCLKNSKLLCTSNKCKDKVQ